MPVMAAVAIAKDLVRGSMHQVGPIKPCRSIQSQLPCEAAHLFGEGTRVLWYLTAEDLAAVGSGSRILNSQQELIRSLQIEPWTLLLAKSFESRFPFIALPVG